MGGLIALRPRLVKVLWCGTSITITQDQRLRHLMRTRAAIRFVSYEPVLGAVDWRPWFEQGLNWLIVGGESGPHAREMNLAWLADTVRQCRDAGVARFVKARLGVASWCARAYGKMLSGVFWLTDVSLSVRLPPWQVSKGSTCPAAQT
jgi:protein gp37